MDLREALEDPSISVISLMALLIDNWGTEFLNWDADTIKMSLEDLIKVDGYLLDKVMTGVTILTEELVTQDLVLFNNTVQVLNNGKLMSHAFLPATLEDVAVGCLELKILLGEDLNYSEDIAVYVGNLLKTHGITEAPSILKFAIIDETSLKNRDENIASDPILFESFWKRHKDILSDLEEDLKERTDILVNQLTNLPLNNADTDIMKTLSSNLSKEANSKYIIKDDVAIANKPLPNGTKIGTVSSNEHIITPEGNKQTIENIQRLGRNLINSRMNNTVVVPKPNGEGSDLMAVDNIQTTEPLTVNIQNQNVIPQNIDYLSMS